MRFLALRLASLFKFSSQENTRRFVCLLLLFYLLVGGGGGGNVMRKNIPISYGSFYQGICTYINSDTPFTLDHDCWLVFIRYLNR